MARGGTAGKRAEMADLNKRKITGKIGVCALLALGLAACQPAPSPASSLPVDIAETAAPPTATVFQSGRISVTTVGEGPDVVLIPGLSSSPRVWTDMVTAVPGYRYHLVQVKGFAGVPAEDNGTGEILSPLSAEITRYIAEQKLTKPALIGHSLGGALAMKVATGSPDMVSKVMVVDMLPFLGPAYGGPLVTSETVEPIAAGIRAGLLAASEDMRTAQITGVVSGMINTEARRPKAITDSLTSQREVSAQAMYELIVLDQRPELPKFTGPLRVLYITPTSIPVTPDMMDAAYQAAFASAPNLSLLRVDDSAHFIMWDQPELFHRDVAAFLAP